MTLGRTVQSAGTWSMSESWLGVVSNDSWESENTLYLFTLTKNQIQVLSLEWRKTGSLQSWVWESV